MTRFLANVNVPVASVNRLRSSGHDVVAVIEESPAATDAEVLSRAAQEDRIVVTFDRDYGELIYRLRLPIPAGVVYFRFDPATPEEPAERLLQLMSVSGLVLERMFTVVERGQVRQRPLP